MQLTILRRIWKIRGLFMVNKKHILDPCCGGRMFYFDKYDSRILFGDIRKEKLSFTDRDKKRFLEINPDVQLDFRRLPFADEQFSLVVFDPPHLVRAGKNSWLATKYGKLNHDWRDDIKQGFVECFRVLCTHGILIFKWNETQIKTSEILTLTNQKPLFGHISGKRANTHWIVFMKEVAV